MERRYIRLREMHGGEELLLPMQAGAVAADGSQGERAPWVTGFYSKVSDLSGHSVFVAYSAKTRTAEERAPAYEDGMYILIDQQVFDGDDVSLKLSRGLLTRTLSVVRGAVPVATVTYRWPFWRESLGRLFATDFDWPSKDFCRQLVDVVSTYQHYRRSHGSAPE